jgi:hypothetical protein
MMSNDIPASAVPSTTETLADSQVKAQLSDEEALALTMWGEARGDAADGSSVEERIAVGCVVRNRLADPEKFGAHTIKDVCLAGMQFSCWNPGGRNADQVMAQARAVVLLHTWADPLLTECFFLADGVISGRLLDRTGGATFYYAPAAMKPEGRVPGWAVGVQARKIGAQLFLRV